MSVPGIGPIISSAMVAAIETGDSFSKDRDSDEASTCKRYAPAAQREKMSKYRAWFHERRRPPRA